MLLKGRHLLAKLEGVGKLRYEEAVFEVQKEKRYKEFQSCEEDTQDFIS